MVRNLYRFYLYAVYIALLIFVTVTIGRLLYTTLLFTSLRASYESIPTHAELFQSVVFAAVSLVIGGLLAGLHYWLIRRDIREDPNASNGAIRSFFLNITELFGVCLAIPVLGFGLFMALGAYP